MTNIVRSRRGKKRGFKIFIIILIIVFVVLNYFKWQPFHSFVLTVSEPVFKVKDIVFSPFNNFFSYFAYKKELEEKNQELQKEIDNLRIEVLSYEILKFEYKNIVEQKDPKEEEVEIAKVILKPPFSGFDSLVLSGEFDESKIGQKVFWKDIVLGEILETTQNTAVVKLLSASGNISPARLKDGNQHEVVGRSSGQYEMILPKDLKVSEGDVIAYPEAEVSILGLVNKVFSTEDDLFNVVLFNIPVDFADINYVRIGKPMKFIE